MKPSDIDWYFNIVAHDIVQSCKCVRALYQQMIIKTAAMGKQGKHIDNISIALALSQFYYILLTFENVYDVMIIVWYNVGFRYSLHSVVYIFTVKRCV